MEKFVLSCEDVTSIRAGRTVLAGVSFRLAAGEGIAVTGPNGAGKSTLLRILAGLLPATAGRVVLTGVGEDGAAGAIHYVGHQDAVKTQLTVRENLGFWARWQGAAAGRTDAAMDAFALTPLADLPAGLLSAGQRRRLGLARILLGERPLWLLDEPTVALDAASRERLRGVIAAHIGAGGILVAATHDDLAIAALPQRPLASLACSAAA